jgi:NDP-sugar pyrophosphorylase family protein
MKEGLILVYMVAGLSSRFGGKIKQFAQISDNGQTLIEKSIEQALPAGFTKIIFIVGNKTEQPFKEKFGNNYKGIPVEYALQTFDEETRDRPWGTADALASTKKIIDSPFVILNGDDLYGEETFKIIADHLKNSKENVTVGYTLSKVLPEEGATNRAIYEIEEGYVKSLEMEKSKLHEINLKPEDLCSMNIFGLQLETLNLLVETISNFKEKHKGDRKIECYLPVELSNLIKENKIKMEIYPTQSKWFGITNPGDEEIIKRELESEERGN